MPDRQGRPRDLSTRLWHRGRLSLIFEPRDIWLGLYVAPGAVYACLLPCLPLRWERRPPDAPAEPETAPEAAGLPSGWLPGEWHA